MSEKHWGTGDVVRFTRPGDELSKARPNDNLRETVNTERMTETAKSPSVWARFANSPFATAAVFSAVVLGAAYALYMKLDDSIDDTRIEIEKNLQTQRAELTHASERIEDRSSDRLDRLEAKLDRLDDKLDRILDAVKTQPSK